MHKKKWRKVALALSAFLFVVWWALGTGATLAWFSDTDTVRNDFQVGLLKLDVSYKNDIVTDYTPLQGATKAFNDQALYEPGYTQVVYLKIENKGDMAFRYRLAVTVDGDKVIKGKTAWGEDIYLPDYLRFGAEFAESEAALKAAVADRLAARTHATEQPLSTWSEFSDYVFEAKEAPHYAALIVYMPEEVDNAANYRGTTVPKVELGISVFAQQANAPTTTD